MRSHLLLRGEQPEIPTGYNLVSLMYGTVKYVDRSVYARREGMLVEHANAVAGADGCVVDTDDFLCSGSNGCGLNLDGPPQVESGKCSRRVVVVSEGAGDVVALLGEIILFDSDCFFFFPPYSLSFLCKHGLFAQFL